MTLTTTFQGQDDPEWSKQYQKWIPHTGISRNRGITGVYTLKSKQLYFHHGRRQPCLVLPLEATFLIWGLDTRTKIVLHTLTLKLLLKTKLLHQFEMKSRNCLCTAPHYYPPPPYVAAHPRSSRVFGVNGGMYFNPVWLPLLSQAPIMTRGCL